MNKVGGKGGVQMAGGNSAAYRGVILKVREIQCHSGWDSES